uniref:5'-(N(7)-methylguanosine 5'-triphospho)-[mRNA] hydrolase n=1 Tax=Sinocyclocheilus grahami TaxID=75366 RepID=A0A672K6B8_SINGR
MECVNKAGQLMSLAALQQHDPYIVNLLDVAGQVALYTFSSKANEWVRLQNASPCQRAHVKRLFQKGIIEKMIRFVALLLSECELDLQHTRFVTSLCSGHSVVKQITVEELFGSSLPKEAPQSTSSTVGERMRGPAFVHSVEPLLAPHLSADPGGTALVSLFQGCGTRDPRPAASNTEESGSRTTSQSVRRGSAGPLPPAYMNPPTDGHGLPGFMPSPLVTPQSFRESACKGPGPFTEKAALSAQSKEANVFTQSSTLVKPIPAGPAVQGEESSLLLSPSVFQHSMTKTAEPLKNPASPTSPTADLPSSLYNRTQLKDTLIHLIKNDAHFLSAIHEAYIQSLSKGLNNIKL